MVRNIIPDSPAAGELKIPFRPAFNADNDRSYVLLREADAHNIRCIGHLLVVAGPSGAGKSTFIRLLADGDLPKDLEALFPSYRRDWPLSGYGVGQGLRIEKYVRGTSIDGLVLHYDPLRFEKRNLPGFDHDELLQKLFSSAKEITVVTIKLTPDALASHVLLRQAKNRGGQTSWMTGLWQFSRLRIRLLRADALRQLRHLLAPLLPTNLKRSSPWPG